MKFKSLYSRIALTFAALILLFGSLCGGLDLVAAKHHQQEIVQRLSKDLAGHIAKHWPLAKANGLDSQAIGELFHMLMIVNPSIEVYLLDNNGVIKAFQPNHKRPDERLQLQQVSLAPIQAFLEGKPLPLTGDNPRNANLPGVFSATELRQDASKAGYLYIILTGQDYQQLATEVWQGHVFQSAMWTGLGALMLTLLAGLGLFAAITRRLNALSCTMAAFEQMDFAGGLHVCPKISRSGDEIGQLACTFEHMAERISKQIQQIHAQDELRREMIANVSHDLRTPLTSMQGYLETLLRKSESLSLEEQRRYLTVAVRQSQRVSHLAHELFELAKLECEEVSPNPEHFFLQELIQDVIQKFELAAQKKQVHIGIALNQDMPMVYADIAMIERVLGNLLDNALRYTPEQGSIKLELLPTADGTVTVRVVDTGKGIAEENLGGLFERHSPLRQGADRTHGGGGLGLLITKRILELHGTTIEAFSKPGQGAMFTFSLPT
ncbi:MAG: HAMP domain-containing sensor histidine kinase [Methylovulum miyakonense]|uniref:HAMP domain-containing sensor histidine kinase n=1 Tax=Methylovulum miyakonense TaxID=645578 RepID=UPI003BB4B34E